MELWRIEELMADHFPWVEPHEREWQNIHDGTRPKLGAISRLLALHIGTPEVLVLILGDRNVGTLVKASEAPTFIGSYVLRGRIHVANPQFTGFVVVQPTGVAAGWKNDA
jgi:hypothetical protein